MSKKIDKIISDVEELKKLVADLYKEQQIKKEEPKYFGKGE